MKKLLTLLGLSVGLFAFSGCEKMEDNIKEKTDVNINVPISEYFLLEIDVATEPDGSATTTETKVIDLEEQPVLQPYLERIKDVKINKVMLLIEEYTGDESIQMTGSIDFGDGNLISIQDFNLHDAYTNGTEISPVNAVEGATYLKNQLLENKKGTMTVNGVVSDVPVEAKVLLMIETTIVANPLD